MTIFHKLSQSETRSMNRGDSNVEKFADKKRECCEKLGDGAACANCGKHTHATVEWLMPTKNSDPNSPAACSSRCALAIKASGKMAASVQAGASMDPAAGRRKELEGVFADNYDRKHMPIADHDYHHKSDQELRYIIKDAGQAAEANHPRHGGDPKAHNKYLDQVNDAHTVLGYRQRHGIFGPRRKPKVEEGGKFVDAESEVPYGMKASVHRHLVGRGFKHSYSRGSDGQPKHSYHVYHHLKHPTSVAVYEDGHISVSSSHTTPKHSGLKGVLDKHGGGKFAGKVYNYKRVPGVDQKHHDALTAAGYHYVGRRSVQGSHVWAHDYDRAGGGHATHHEGKTWLHAPGAKWDRPGHDADSLKAALEKKHGADGKGHVREVFSDEGSGGLKWDDYTHTHPWTKMPQQRSMAGAKHGTYHIERHDKEWSPTGIYHVEYAPREYPGSRHALGRVASMAGAKRIAEDHHKRRGSEKR